jgi:predicted RNA-binding protein associated with RNAse of E/G family
MQAERKKILEMLSAGKINVEEAERLLTALNGNSETEEQTTPAGKRLKYLRVVVEPKPGSATSERVNVRVPINLIRAGLKWISFIPKHAQHRVGDALKEKGLAFDFDNLSSQDLEELIMNLNDLQVEVDGDETVRVFCE